ncbi:MAG: DUF389 domain-containing protein [Okeania sp. SIO3H1]|nr:DUF389 domain-containing protein [Okeania sp. SIO3H1]
MTVLARFRAVPEQDKAALVRKLVQSGTADFDYFYLVGLSTLMATFGLLLDSSSIVIGSMLIAPLMYPILGVALGLVMMGDKVSVLHRATKTLVTSLLGGVVLATIAAALFGDEAMYQTAEVMARTEPHLLHFFVAIVAGAAVAYMLARPEWSETLPGVAIAVALIPPLATIGIGLAAFDMAIIRGAFMILLLNLIGIIGVATFLFLLMNLGEKEKIAESTMKKEEEKQEKENQVIAEVAEQITVKKEKTTVVKEDIVA